MKIELKQVLCPQPKSKIKASDGKSEGKYKFFTSSPMQTRFIDEANYDKPSLIFGTGGNASVHFCDEPFSTSTDCLVMYGRNKIELESIYNYLKGNISLLEHGFKGAGLKHISKDYILAIEIELPSEAMQHEFLQKNRIVDEIIEAKRTQLLLSEDLVKSRFIEMFVADKNVCNWSQVSISDVSTNMRTGPFGSALHHDEFVDSGVFVLGIDNAVENRFSYNRMRYITEEKYNQLKRYTVYPGDVIITIMGTVGRSAVIPQDMPKAINTKHLACITPDSAVVDPCFLSSAFQMHPAIRLQLQNQCKGAIMDGLNLTIIKGLRFQLPPIDQQKQFSEFVEQTDKSKFYIVQMQILLRLLIRAIQQKTTEVLL